MVKLFWLEFNDEVVLFSDFVVMEVVLFRLGK